MRVWGRGTRGLVGSRDRGRGEVISEKRTDRKLAKEDSLKCYSAN